MHSHVSMVDNGEVIITPVARACVLYKQLAVIRQYVAYAVQNKRLEVLRPPSNYAHRGLRTRDYVISHGNGGLAIFCVFFCPSATLTRMLTRGN